MSEQLDIFTVEEIQEYGVIIEETVKAMVENWDVLEKEPIIKPYERTNPITGDLETIGYVFRPFNTMVFNCQEMKGLKIYRFYIKDFNAMEGIEETKERVREKYLDILEKGAVISDCPSYISQSDRLFVAEIPLDGQKLKDYLLTIEPVLKSLYLWACEHEKVESFSSCGYYMICSEIGRCVHEMTDEEYGDRPKRFHSQEPDIKFAKGCQYRKNLRRGYNFYAQKR